MEHEETNPPNFLKDYSYARSLLKNTSRGKNPDWYRDAHLLSNQLHLFETGTRYTAYYWNETSNEWQLVNALPGKVDPSVLEEYLQYLQLEVFPSSCRSLGVVLHLNQEASVFEFPNQDWNEVQAGSTLSELIRSNPSLVLQDRTLAESNMTFRVFPTPASPHVATSGCAVATSRRGEELLAAFREVGNETNFPIQTSGLSSPLLLLARLPRTLGVQEKAFCIMLRFDEFSFFGFYTVAGELIVLRSIKHANKQLPHTLESTLTTTAASVELSDMELKVFDCRAQKTPALDTELGGVLFNLSYQVFVPPASEELPLPIELSTFQIEDDNPGLVFSETETFGTNISEGYHLQDFLSPSDQELDLLPGALDMKVLRLGRIFTRVALAACLLFGAYVGVSSFSKTSSESWKKGQTSTSEALTLSKDLKKVKATEQFLADRSKGWATLELFARLFPLDGSVRFNTAEHKASPEGTNVKLPSTSLVKKWTIQGFALEQATDSLVRLNTQEGMGEVFKAVESNTGNSSFDLSQNTRNLMVNLDLEENTSFNRNAPQGTMNAYPYQFSLEITQRIESGDTLAIPVTKL